MTDNTMNISEDNLKFEPSLADKAKGFVSGVFHFVAVAVPSALAFAGLATLSLINKNPDIQPLLDKTLNVAPIPALAISIAIGVVSGVNTTRNSALRNGRVKLKL